RLPRLPSMTLTRLAMLAAPQSPDKPRLPAPLEEARRTADTSHDQRALVETEWTLAQTTSLVWGDTKQALSHGQHALELARASNNQELEARSLSLLGWIHIRIGDFQEAMHGLEGSLELFAPFGTEQ